MQSNETDIIVFKKVIRTRKSWKIFNKVVIPAEIINSIIDDTNYCPSSFNLQPWKILIMKNEVLKHKLAPYCHNQPQVFSCSHLLIILSYKERMFALNNPWMINNCITRKNLKTITAYKNFYQNTFLPYIQQIKNWNEWSIRQAYILLQTILLSAAAHKVDSCPMEGIATDKIINFLESNQFIIKDQFNCPYIIALGYHDNSNIKLTTKIKDENKVIFLD